MAKNENVWITSQIWSAYSHHKKEEKRRRITAQLLNQNGFIISMLGPKKNGGGWENKINFYCKQDNMPILAAVMEQVIKDIENENFSQERSMWGSKSNISFPTKKSKDKLYIGIKITKKDDDGNETGHSETFLLETRTQSGVHEGLAKFRALKDDILKTYHRQSSTYDQHFKKYFEATEGGGNNKSSNKSSGSSSSSNYSPEDDDDFPFE